MHYRVWIWIIGRTLAALEEQSIIRIKDALADKLKPLLGETSLINSLLVMEFNYELLLPAAEADVLELLVGVSENLISPNLNVDLIIVIRVAFANMFLDHDPPKQSLAVELKDFRHFVDDCLELLTDCALVRSYKFVDKLSIGEEEAY